MERERQSPTGPDAPNGGQPPSGPGAYLPGHPSPAQPGVPLAPAAPAQQPVARKGKRGLLVGALAVALACAGLCGVGQLITNMVNQDDWEGRGQPVPASSLPAEPKPTWQRPNMLAPDAKADPQIRYDLETWVLASAGVAKPMTSRCETDGFQVDRPARFDCTVTYAGKPVVFEVDTRPAGGSLFEWEATTKQTVVTREGLLALVHRRYGGSGWSDLRCEEFPEVALVTVGERLSQACYAKRDEASKTSRITITPTSDAEPTLLTEHQEEGLR